jgi:hypothetical protein
MGPDYNKLYMQSRVLKYLQNNYSTLQCPFGNLAKNKIKNQNCEIPPPPKKELLFGRSLHKAKRGME